MQASHQETVLPIYIVDAFSNRAFQGNGAAICLLSSKTALSEEVKQKMAEEMKLSETAFVSLIDPKETFQKGSRFSLQWFTPKCEVPLCGHATLASAAVLFSICGNDSSCIEFETLSGTLGAKRLTKSKIEIDLPAYDSKPADSKKYESVVKAALGSLPIQEIILSDSDKLLVRLKDSVTRRELLAVNPQGEPLMSAAPDLRGLIVTLKGSDEFKDDEGRAYDFVSRYFAPWNGILEDPVTGSAHSVLAPFWSKILKKNEFYALQCSPRGGRLEVRLEKDRVAVAGEATVVVRGHISF